MIRNTLILLADHLQLPKIAKNNFKTPTIIIIFYRLQCSESEHKNQNTVLHYFCFNHNCGRFKCSLVIYYKGEMFVCTSQRLSYLMGTP